MKKKLIALALAICAVVACVSTASLAYFTDNKTVDNVFTAGEVTITLDEAKVTPDGANHAQVDPSERVRVDEQNYGEQNYGKLYPGQVVTKDPTITVTGSESAYVGAKVVINSGVDITDANDEYFANLLSGGLLAANDNTVKVVKQVNAADKTYEIYIAYKTAMTQKEKVILFDTLSIAGDYGNTDMENFKGMHITVNAYAVQAVGFHDALVALTTAFSAELGALATNP
jgi:predicted ribosomally synthesized peptide with SipW-like signal peptide